MITSFNGRATLRSDARAWTLVPQRDADPDEQRAALPPGRALVETAWSLPQVPPWDDLFLREALIDVLRSADVLLSLPSDLTTEQLRDELLRAIEQGLVLLLAQEEAPLQVAAALAGRQPLPPAAVVASEVASWIHVEIVDETGAPYQGRVELVLPDGQLRTVTTSPQGLVQLTTDTPGTFKLTLPGLDAQAWGP
jgi:hypothetical protein